MRPIITAIALFASSVFALNNADFNPVNFAAEEVGPAPLNEKFSTFRWRGDKAFAKESFNVKSDSKVRIQVTDYKNRGDMFEVFDNGKSLGKTSKVESTKDEEVFAVTPEDALKDERFSKGVFDLAAGEHKITIKAVGPYEAGTAAIRILNQAKAGFYKKEDKHHHDDHHNDKHHHDDHHDNNHHHDDHHDNNHHHDDHDDNHHHSNDHHDDNHHHSDDHHDDNHHHSDDHHGNKHHYDGDGCNDKKPTAETLDLSHTITIQTTVYVAAKPTHVEII